MLAVGVDLGAARGSQVDAVALVGAEGAVALLIRRCRLI